MPDATETDWVSLTATAYIQGIQTAGPVTDTTILQV